MDYRDLEGAVIDAYRREDYALCFSLLDQFSETSDAQDRASAISLKASLISRVDHRRAAEGLTLIEESLPLLQDDPQATLRTLVTALWLCYAIGDIARATTYETLGHHLLRKHGHAPHVRRSQHRLHLNLGMLASVRGEHATAYWHFVQGTTSVLTAGPDDGSDGKAWLFSLYLRTARTCLLMGRLPEAEEALQQAERCAVTAPERLRWLVERAELLRQRGRPDEAAAGLAAIEYPPPEAVDAETRTRCLIVRALVAKDSDDLRGFHRHLAGAREEAAANSLDFLLSDIQRIARG